MALCRTCADYRNEPREDMPHVSIKHRHHSVKTCDSCEEKLSEARGAWEPNHPGVGSRDRHMSESDTTECPTCLREVDELVNGVCETCDFIASKPPTFLNRISGKVLDIRKKGQEPT